MRDTKRRYQIISQEGFIPPHDKTFGSFEKIIATSPVNWKEKATEGFIYSSGNRHSQGSWLFFFFLPTV